MPQGPKKGQEYKTKGLPPGRCCLLSWMVVAVLCIVVRRSFLEPQEPQSLNRSPCQRSITKVRRSPEDIDDDV